MSQTETLKESKWVESTPLPYYMAFGLRKCSCGRIFLGDKQYKKHYQAVHIKESANE